MAQDPADTGLGAPGTPGDEPIDLPYVFQKFGRPTIERFVCFESPTYRELKEDPELQDLFPKWCFKGPAGEIPLCGIFGEQAELGNRHLEVAAGTIGELYQRIRKAFNELDGLFSVKSPPEVVIPVEYDVFVFPVTDRDSAVRAIDLILRQGEGLQSQWTYESHFRRFSLIRRDLVALRAADDAFDPAYNLMTNPTSGAIGDGFAGDFFDLFNHAYETLLLMLAGLYQRFVPTAGVEDRYPHLSTSLPQNAFAPAMTMIVRSMSEILVRLPVPPDRDGADRTFTSRQMCRRCFVPGRPNRRSRKRSRWVISASSWGAGSTSRRPWSGSPSGARKCRPEWAGAA
jgi:hypothetical protein